MKTNWELFEAAGCPSMAVIEWQMAHMDVGEIDESGDIDWREPTWRDALSVLADLD